MKVEVEYEEMERLRDKIKRLESENKELTDQLNELSEDELKKKAVHLSWRLFDEYIRLTFRKLGFKVDDWDSSVISRDDLSHFIGKKWYNHDERINITLNATLTEQFMQAFLNIGIASDRFKKDEDHQL